MHCAASIAFNNVLRGLAQFRCAPTTYNGRLNARDMCFKLFKESRCTHVTYHATVEAKKPL